MCLVCCIVENHEVSISRLTKTGSIGIVKGVMKATVLQLTALAANLVVLALYMVVTVRTGAHVHCVSAWCAILQRHKSFMCLVIYVLCMSKETAALCLLSMIACVQASHQRQAGPLLS